MSVHTLPDAIVPKRVPNDPNGAVIAEASRVIAIAEEGVVTLKRRSPRFVEQNGLEDLSRAISQPFLVDL